MAKITKILLFAVLALGATCVPQVLAHSEGASFEQVVGDYLIDVGYDPEEITAGEPVRFDFELQDSSNEKETNFTNIWVRIEQGNKAFFAGSIARARFGLTGILYTFGEKGDYELFVRFEDDNGAIVETFFPVTVKNGSEENEGSDGYTDIFLALLGGLALGILVSLMIKRKK